MKIIRDHCLWEYFFYYYYFGLATDTILSQLLLTVLSLLTQLGLYSTVLWAILYFPKLSILPILSLTLSSHNQPSAIAWIESLIKDDSYRPTIRFDEMKISTRQKHRDHPGQQSAARGVILSKKVKVFPGFFQHFFFENGEKSQTA